MPKINSVWAQRSSTSEKLLSNVIEQNPSTGLFDSKTGELVAWCLMLETGSMGNLQVDERYDGRKFGQITYAVQMLKVAKNREIFGHYVHQNAKSIYLAFNKGGHSWVDNNSWIGVKKRAPLKLVPLWGHL